MNARELPLKSCEGLILTEHYSRRLPSAVKLCYGDVDYGPPKVIKACCVFSVATGRWPEPLWELTRLVRLPGYVEPLSKLVAGAVGCVRKSNGADLIVSFADGEEDHHGGVYQACSWVYSGMRGDRLDGFNIDGEFVPARTCNAVHGTSSVTDLPLRLKGREVVPHFDDGKHCYWKALTKDGMRKAIRMGLTSVPYPKPMLAAGNAAGINSTREISGHERKGVVALPTTGAVRIDSAAVNTAQEGASKAAEEFDDVDLTG